MSRSRGPLRIAAPASAGNPVTKTHPTNGLADLAPPPRDADARAVVTVRLLAADAVQAAGSGHPGLPMGAAAPAYVLWSRFLRHDPGRPDWPDSQPDQMPG